MHAQCHRVFGMQEKPHDIVIQPRTAVEYPLVTASSALEGFDGVALAGFVEGDVDACAMGNFPQKPESTRK